MPGYFRVVRRFQNSRQPVHSFNGSELVEYSWEATLRRQAWGPVSGVPFPGTPRAPQGGHEITIYVVNTFTQRMLSGSAIVKFQLIDDKEAKELLRGQEFMSAIGHDSTAKLISKLLGITVPSNRKAISLEKDDALLVFELGIDRNKLIKGDINDEEFLSKLKHKWWLVTLL